MELKLLNRLAMTLPLFVIVWTLVYIIICYRSPRLAIHPEWWCRLTVVVLAIAVCSSIAYCLFVIGPNPFIEVASFAKANKRFHTWACLLCLIYFIYDLSWSVIFQTEAPVMLMHHVLSLYGISYVLYRGSMANELLATIFTSEITNPLLQIRWFMYESMIHKTWYAELNTFIFIVIFLFSRVILGTYFIYIYMQSSITEFPVKCACIGIYIVSMVFAFNIAVYAKRHYQTMWRNRLRDEASTTSKGAGAVPVNGNKGSKISLNLDSKKSKTSGVSMLSSIGPSGMKFGEKELKKEH